MATAQGFIQPIAQDAQQTSPNNGNPNTVYNVAPPGAAPAGGWASAGVNPAANYTGMNVGEVIKQAEENLKTQGWAPPTPAPNAQPAGQGIITLPQGWAESIKNFQPKTTPQEQPTTGAGTQQPSIDLNKQWVIVAGNKPWKNDDYYYSDPAYAWAWDTTLAEHRHMFNGKGYGKGSDANWIANRVRELYIERMNGVPYVTLTEKENAARAAQGAGGGGGGSGDNSSSVGSGGTGWVDTGGAGPNGGRASINFPELVNSINNSGGQTSNTGWNSNNTKSVTENLTNFFGNAVNNLGSNASASKVMEMLDKLSEPFLPGNMWMSTLGKANGPNVLAAIMNQVVPGLGTLGKWLANQIPSDVGGVLGKIRNFFQNGKFQEAANEIYQNYDMEKAQNNAIYGEGGGFGGGDFGGWSGGGATLPGGVNIIDGRDGLTGGRTWVGDYSNLNNR